MMHSREKSYIDLVTLYLSDSLLSQSKNLPSVNVIVLLQLFVWNESGWVRPSEAGGVRRGKAG